MWEKKEGKYPKTLAKIQITKSFVKQDMRRNVLPKFKEICLETLCCCSSRWRPEINRNKSVNLSLEELKTILFLTQEMVR